MPAGRPDRRRSRCGEGASLVAFDRLADDHLAGILGVATQAASHLLIANWRTLRGNLCAASPARLRSAEGTRRGNRAGRLSPRRDCGLPRTRSGAPRAAERPAAQVPRHGSSVKLDQVLEDQLTPSISARLDEQSTFRKSAKLDRRETE